MKKKLLISFSGGETSAYMAQWLWNNKRDEYDMIFVFANTGEENEETLQFVNQCEIEFGFPVVWVEAAPRVSLFDEIVDMCLWVFKQDWIGGKIGCRAKVVNYLTASRNGEPFEAVIQKYGIPNMAMPHCTRELKEAPIKAYARSIGWKQYYTAIGIRGDEIDRVNAKHKKKRLIYPLLDMRPMDKKKINFWWSTQKFRLQLKGYEGNCKVCWKKADSKLYQLSKEAEYKFAFFGKMEARYGRYTPDSRLKLMEERGEMPIYPVTFYRKNRSVEDIINEGKQWNGVVIDDSLKHPDDFVQGELDLVESCEVFSECNS